MRIPPRHTRGPWTAAFARGTDPPVAALAATGAVPPAVVPHRVGVPAGAVRDVVAGRPRSRPAGQGARAAAVARHGLSRSPDDGERLRKEVTR
ncbi:hypothetical protein [Streptomyces sp. NPDC007904]|jgi:hypothetical protein|uniref:hypothetical protein n=1 Tax=Streptomyces sp. NPDC007904 TaxID=3364787 RepID=UPI0036E24E0E